MTYAAPRFVDQCCLILNWTLRDIFQSSQICNHQWLMQCSFPDPDNPITEPPPPPKRNCLPDYTPYQYGCYRLLRDTKMTWEEMRDECRSHSTDTIKTDLVSIHCSAEDATLHIAVMQSEERVWIGFQRNGVIISTQLMFGFSTHLWQNNINSWHWFNYQIFKSMLLSLNVLNRQRPSFPYCVCFFVCHLMFHHDVIKWKHCPCYWPFVWGIHRWPVNLPHKGQ